MIPLWSYLISMSIYITILLLLTEATRRSIIFGFMLNICLVILLFFSKNIDGWFRWAKDLSVLIPMIVVSIGRLSSSKQFNSRIGKFFRGNVVLGFFAAMVALNILEASIKGIELGNYANGICGLLLMATIPFSIKKAWRFDENDRNTLVSDLTLTWCLLYTSWNACFVYGESPAFFASSLCILLVPEIYNIVSVKRKKANLWLHARIYTLMIHVSIRSFYDVFTPYMNAESWHNDLVWKYWGIINVVVMGVYSIWWFIRFVPKKENSPITAS